MRLRIEVDGDAFEDNNPVTTLNFHAGSDNSGPVLARATVNRERRPTTPYSGSASVDVASGTVTLTWKRFYQAAQRSRPDHYEVVIPNPADADAPLYRDLDVDDSPRTTNLAIADAWVVLGTGTHKAEVRHCNAVGGCSTALEITFTLPVLAPAPSGLTTGPVTDATVDLSWDTVTGTDRYRVERRSAPDGEWTTVNDAVTGTSFSVTGLDHSTGYEFRVRARGDGTTYPAGFGVPSATVSATTAFLFDPSPLGLGGTSDVWTVPAGVTSVYVSVGFSSPGGLEAGAGSIRVSRVDSAGSVLGTLAVRAERDSGPLSGAASGSRVRLDVDGDAFHAGGALVTLTLHSGTDATGPVLARATVRTESRPATPTSGSAAPDPAAGSVTLGWSAGTLRTGSSPDHYEVVVPDPSNPRHYPVRAARSRRLAGPGQPGDSRCLGRAGSGHAHGRGAPLQRGRGVLRASCG